jgi:hypothetical protein
MNDQITVGAAAVMTSLVGLTGMARWWVRPEPTGQRTVHARTRITNGHTSNPDPLTADTAREEAQ